MPRKILTFVLSLLFLTLNPLAILAQDKSWDAVTALKDAEVAVQMTQGKTVFGRFVSADANKLEIRIADQKDVAAATTSIPKSDIKKIWFAKLRFGKRNTAKGALIGTAAGAAVGAAIWAGLPRDESTDGLEVLALPMALGIGAAIGTVAGFLSRSGHKKGKLIYKV